MISASGDLVGAVLSRRYRLTKKLGEGGMGSVYAAQGVDDARTCAVKIVHPEWLGELTVLSRFLEEGRTAQRLVHPNILRVFETAEAEDGSPYLVMELLQGVPLSAYTANGGRVPPAQAVPILQGVLAGLATAHAQGVVHRDLKPDNVFLARDAAGAYAVKVLDFGIAKVMDAAGGMGSRTKTGVLLGTPAYMSPEQVKNAKDVDARADLWSAGVMLYEMLTGRVAFPAPTEYARLSAILTASPELVEKIDPQLAPFGPVFQKCLAKDRDLRFASALEMARALATAARVHDGGSGEQTIPGEALPMLPPGGALAGLPDVPSVFAPSVLAPSPAAMPSEGLIHAAPLTAPAKAPGGTLASRETPLPSPARQSHAPASPNVVVVSSGHVPAAGSVPGGTLPSQDLPMLQLRSVPPPKRMGLLLVAVLVVLALGAGFLLGYGFAHMR